MQDHITPRRVVVLGGGAGLFTVRALRRSPVAVTVVDRRARQSCFGHNEFDVHAPGMKALDGRSEHPSTQLAGLALHPPGLPHRFP